MALSKRRTPVDRAYAYVDSPLMTHRVHYGRQLAARIQGNHGIYYARVQLGRGIENQCSCPSDWRPCKHVRALRLTWEENPDSFFDLQNFLTQFSTRSKAALLEAIANMAMRAPEGLGALGVAQFAEEEVEWQ